MANLHDQQSALGQMYARLFQHAAHEIEAVLTSSERHDRLRAIFRR